MRVDNARDSNGPRELNNDQPYSKLVLPADFKEKLGEMAIGRHQVENRNLNQHPINLAGNASKVSMLSRLSHLSHASNTSGPISQKMNGFRRQKSFQLNQSDLARTLKMTPGHQSQICKDILNLSFYYKKVIELQ